MNIVCWSTGLQRVVRLRDQSGKTLRTACSNNWLRSYGRLRILVVDQQRNLCSRIFTKRVESDGTRLEVTLLEAPWKNGTTERARKDWKEDYYKMTQDGPEVQTWTDFHEDCDTVNQARASKNQWEWVQWLPACFRQKPCTVGGCHFGVRRSRLRVVSREQAGELTQECSMIVRRLALQASLALDHKRRWKRALHHAANISKVNYMLDNPFASGVERMQPTNQQMLFRNRFSTTMRRHTNTSRST